MVRVDTVEPLPSGGKAPGRLRRRPLPPIRRGPSEAPRGRDPRARATPDMARAAGACCARRAKKTGTFKVQTACRVRIERTNECECALGARGDGVEVLPLEAFFSLASAGRVGRSVGAAFFFFFERATTTKRGEPLRVANVKTQANLKKGSEKRKSARRAAKK